MRLPEECPSCRKIHFTPTVIESPIIVCDNCGYEFSEWTEFNEVELRAIYRILEHQYISYEDVEAHDVVNKISKALRDYDKIMDRRNC